MRLTTCIACGGFVPAPSAGCPHCEAPRPGVHDEIDDKQGSRFVRLWGGGALALTLSACYGMAPHPYHAEVPEPRCDPALDVDGDGFCEDDCDEADPQIYPGAPDPEGDAIDQNCDGVDGVALPGRAAAAETPDAVIASP
jgi:hypothetical protein